MMDEYRVHVRWGNKCAFGDYEPHFTEQCGLPENNMQPTLAEFAKLCNQDMPDYDRLDPMMYGLTLEEAGAMILELFFRMHKSSPMYSHAFLDVLSTACFTRNRSGLFSE